MALHAHFTYVYGTKDAAVLRCRIASAATPLRSGNGPWSHRILASCFQDNAADLTSAESEQHSTVDHRSGRRDGKEAQDPLGTCAQPYLVAMGKSER